MRRFHLFPAWILLGLTGAAHAAPPAVTVEKTPPHIERRSFDPRHPPEEIRQKLAIHEGGLCAFKFRCEIETGNEMPRDNLPTVQATITSIRIVTHLDLTIWTMAGATPKLHAHEEAHREICEDYYQLAEPVALRLAKPAIGKKITIVRADGITRAVEAFQQQLIQEFLRETAGRCTVAQTRFDAITAHGLNPIREANAMAQALAEEHLAYENKPKVR